MYTFYNTALVLHAIFGLISLVLFWIPILLRKGSPKHKQIGNLFNKTILITGVSGLMMALPLFLDPIGVRFRTETFTPESLALTITYTHALALFLLVLALLLLTNSRHSKLVLIAKKDRRVLRKPVNLLLPSSLLITAVFLIPVAIQQGFILYGIFAVVAILNACPILYYIFKAEIKHFEWVIAHLTATISGGIAAHTGFFVFGAYRILGVIFTDQLGLLTWTAPSVIGTIAIILTANHYKRKYGLTQKAGESIGSVKPL